LNEATTRIFSASLTNYYGSSGLSASVHFGQYSYPSGSPSMPAYAAGSMRAEQTPWAKMALWANDFAQQLSAATASLQADGADWWKNTVGGADYVFSDPISAYRTYSRGVEDHYARRVLTDYSFRGGDFADSRNAATGIGAIVGDFVGATTLSEAQQGLSIFGENLSGLEVAQEWAGGISQAAFAAAPLAPSIPPRDCFRTLADADEHH
jgi:hypothetical protein